MLRLTVTLYLHCLGQHLILVVSHSVGSEDRLGGGGVGGLRSVLVRGGGGGGDVVVDQHLLVIELGQHALLPQSEEYLGEVQ